MNKIHFMIGLIFIGTSLCLNAEDILPLKKPQPSQLQFLRESWLNRERDIDSLLEELEKLEEQREAEVSGSSSYQRALSALFKGQVYFESGKKRESLEALEACLVLADTSLASHETSDAWRVKAEANSMIMLQKGFAYRAANYNRVPEQARKALDLDEGNARAEIVMAQYYCNAPPMAGGNISEGLEMLKKLLNRDDLSKIDKYTAVQSLVMVYNDLGNEDEAAYYRQRAKELYPGG